MVLHISLFLFLPYATALEPSERATISCDASSEFRLVKASELLLEKGCGLLVLHEGGIHICGCIEAHERALHAHAHAHAKRTDV